MNVTFSMFPSAGAEAANGLAATVPGGSESLTGQSVGASNPFASLLSGQLRNGPAGAGPQALLLATAGGKLPLDGAANLPQTGNALPVLQKPLPDAADAGDDGEAVAKLLPLQLAAALQASSQPQDMDAKVPVQMTPDAAAGEGGPALNIMKLALGEVLSEKQPASTTQDSDDQLIQRMMHAGTVRVEGERAAALLQANQQHMIPRTELSDQTSSNSNSAAPLNVDGVRAPVDVQNKPAPAPVAQASLQQPLGKDAWNQDLGSRLVWMSKQNLDSAQLRLNPAHLGPLEVRLSVQHDQTANVTFLSNHAPVRDAVEAAIPRLREMLADSGVNLSDVNVSSHSQGQQRDHGPASNAWLADGQPDLDGGLPEETVRNMALGLVDYFA